MEPNPNLRPGEDLQHYVERQAVEMQQRATELQDAFAAAAATVSSRDGAVTVSLAPNGALRNIQLGKRACELGEARLTATIMDTVRQAQRQTAQAVAGSVESIMGGGEVLEMMQGFLPTDPAADGGMDQTTFAREPESDADPQPSKPTTPPSPPPPPPPSSRPAPRRRPAQDEADDDEVNPW
ncbi:MULTISPECIES: YbaB/EbfC family nucleoid-associated protein [Prauserella salsuginis group]|uniref:YbaB/EbfC family nucleoid-associated protein n=1 Tax=Prauserella salsuginis TaxID=387889 RepID=A0ABW6G1N0_9PSEU|nr:MULTISPECIES: YbaB/EbfC family nucleoid-associated protein [Prauserella salsuginis group]MCR3722207.1 Conserved DNA-binding protein YbaB [Prauserella flava]MCR3736205.1 Conserved DNA-binding protein YbaB [Prauserella salsuginis]